MLVYIDTSDIHEGQLEAVKTAMTDLARWVEEAEPQLISYAFHLDGDEAQMNVVAVHPDSASLELHMNLGRERFRAFGEFITMRSIDVYGEPSATVVELLRQKANMLGTGRVRIHRLHAGFTRADRAPTGSA